MLTLNNTGFPHNSHSLLYLWSITIKIIIVEKSVLMLMVFFIALTVYATKRQTCKFLSGAMALVLMLPEADMPNLKNLMKDGSWSFKARSVLPSSSAWLGVYDYGTGPTLHSYTEWNSTVRRFLHKILQKKNVSFHFQYTKRARTLL